MILSLSNEAGSIILLAKIPSLRVGIFTLGICVCFLSNQKIISTRLLAGKRDYRLSEKPLFLLRGHIVFLQILFYISISLKEGFCHLMENKICR